MSVDTHIYILICGGQRWEKSEVEEEDGRRRRRRRREKKALRNSNRQWRKGERTAPMVNFLVRLWKVRPTPWWRLCSRISISSPWLTLIGKPASTTNVPCQSFFISLSLPSWLFGSRENGEMFWFFVFLANQNQISVFSFDIGFDCGDFGSAFYTYFISFVFWKDEKKKTIFFSFCYWNFGLFLPRLC